LWIFEVAVSCMRRSPEGRVQSIACRSVFQSGSCVNTPDKEKELWYKKTDAQRTTRSSN
jgi:hypothetical protein